jgi:hypothetical protein
LSRRARLAAAVVSAALLLAAAAGAAPVALGPRGIGAVQLGLPELKAVKELTHLLGAPSARGVNTGCGRRYTEVEWGDLVAEFRLGTFSGFRYINGGYPLTTPGSPREPSRPRTVFRKLATAMGIALGSTIAQLRTAYGSIRLVGADRWRTHNGLVFVDDAKPISTARLRHIIEIKFGTCGDF